MDEILLKGMTFYGYHGALEEENRLGQRFIIDAKLGLSLQKAGETDQLEHTVSYADVFENIRNICEGERYSLIEALAHRIAQCILDNFNIVQKVQISVKKPQAPISGMFDYMQVSVRRVRNG
ncbi:dihydroneopterin aldolase [Peptoclostridium litorale DSM 5388]|uniref:7,8-dihydroneopterin aldolase n=1 Tax=Peptoclostridium litorale DSM 5388 TaxID=1121324 RepID=A0A069RBG8_PEPLI|nr:dihydroneopterin aldolase [Peptoclostridium litorale]KDR94419.1 dihydroneopterin aldolase FolB [Peptoclostridium litorale DSM 5388]SIO24209.1 dihydroneopterin aldolase [Peptoclostridium litorale DSM 5388]